MLKHLGFSPRPRKSTSHVNWVRNDERGFRKVTVDANNAPFKDQALKWMLDQMGVRKNEFYAILRKL